jgi:hypothetical protein
LCLFCSLGFANFWGKSSSRWRNFPT